MIPKFNFKGKSVFSAYCSILRDLIFPPFCTSCEGPLDMKLFCSDCWSLCASPDPIDKCPHCFEDSEGLCSLCRRSPDLPFPQAYVFEDTEPAWILVRQQSDILASFMIRSWIQLDWEVPDVIFPMPGMEEVAFLFAEMIERPLAHFSDVDAIDEHQVILVIDQGSSLEELRKAIRSLSSASPKKGYLLTLFQTRG
jgi:hypothetical protein